MNRDEAIAIIRNEIACVKTQGCDRVCGNCSLAKTESEIVGAFEMAIKALEGQLMEYDDMCRRLRSLAEGSSRLSQQGYDLLNNAANAIEELCLERDRWIKLERKALLKSIPKWISVKERLPGDKAEMYWCFTEMGVMCECRWTNNRYGLGASDRWGWNVMDVPQYQKITHWMPLPEPPKEEP